jgi:heptaprenyl diphosphate synthase
LFSISGGYLSLVAMYFFSKFEFSTISVSIIGAISHNIGQVLMASIIILNMNMFSYLPFILFTSIITGVFVGFSVKFTLNKFNTTFFINY